MAADGTILWYVRLHNEGREQRFGSFPTKTAAREYYEKAKAEQKLGRFFPERYQHSGSAKIQDVIDAYMATNTNKTAEQDQHYADFWKDWFGGATLKAVTPESIEKAKVQLSERTIGKKDDKLRPITPQTVLHYLKFLRHVMNIAVRDGKLDRNPMARVGLPKVHKGRLRFLDMEEEKQLAQAIGPTYAPWVRFAILTGLRREEQFSLRWTDVDVDRGVVTIPVTKAGGARYVHLNEEAKTLLRGLDSWLRSPWVFPSQNSATHLDSDNFYRRVYLPAVQKAKLDGVTWHTLRHTFASRLAMAGCDRARHRGMPRSHHDGPGTALRALVPCPSARGRGEGSGLWEASDQRGAGRSGFRNNRD
jgi:integrase